MRIRFGGRLFTLLCFGLLTLMVGPARAGVLDTTGHQEVHLTARQSAALREGDLIFRRSEGMGSNMIYTVDPGSVFSHVGLAVEENGQIYVVHILPGEGGTSPFARLERLEQFLKTIQRVAVYRLAKPDPAAAARAAQAARAAVGVARFDLTFDLFEAEQLYCTELVWGAYQAAGVDLVDGQFDRLRVPFLKAEQFILPSSLAASPLLEKVLDVSSP